MANYSRRIGNVRSCRKLLDWRTDLLAASDLNQLEHAVWIPLASSVSDAACQPLVSPRRGAHISCPSNRVSVWLLCQALREDTSAIHGVNSFGYWSLPVVNISLTILLGQ